MQTDAFCQTIAQALEKEHRFLLSVSADSIFSLPKTTLQYLCGKAVYNNREKIFGNNKVEWVWNSQAAGNIHKPVVFKVSDGEHYLVTDFICLDQDDDLLVNMQAILQSLQQHKKLAAVIIRATQKQAEVWIEKWQDKIGSILKPCSKPVLMNGPDEKNIWLTIWQDAAPAETADVHNNVDNALEEAVRDMYFESMMHVMKRIVSLRTNLDENIINAQTEITTIFKMVFAKEQGVGLDDVYDPEAFAGLKDSQLAAGNFVNDMQKAFNVNFNNEEIASISTIKDLVGIIIHKKTG